MFLDAPDDIELDVRGDDFLQPAALCRGHVFLIAGEQLAVFPRRIASPAAAPVQIA